MLNTNDQQALDTLLANVQERSEHFIGYPIAVDFDYSDLFKFFQFPLNNVGDPFQSSTYSMGTREMEREVVAFFANLFRAEEKNWWGYVTNGGSEGNLYALYTARDLYPNGIVYYSEATHYSIQKNIHLLNMQSILVKTTANGEIDYEDLRQLLRMKRLQPAIIVANIGTTMTEAKDDVKAIKEVLKELAIRNHYIHSDAALAGIYSAFLDNKPNFDMSDGADSIAISGHKFVGSPMPTGVVVVKKINRDRMERSVSYVGTSDTTISGSRSGHSPLFLWYAIKKLGIAGFKSRAQQSLKLAAYLESSLNKLGMNAWRNGEALTVIFNSPSKSLINKWQLASENGQSHIICMPGINKERLEAFLSELAEELSLVHAAA